MICDNCDRTIDGPPFGKVGETLCWDCYSGEVLPEDDSHKEPTPRLTAMQFYTTVWRPRVPASEALLPMPAQEARCTK